MAEIAEKLPDVACGLRPAMPREARAASGSLPSAVSPLSVLCVTPFFVLFVANLFVVGSRRADHSMRGASQASHSLNPDLPGAPAITRGTANARDVGTEISHEFQIVSREFAGQCHQQASIVRSCDPRAKGRKRHQSA